jgi:hypothetical protein
VISAPELGIVLDVLKWLTKTGHEKGQK